MVIHAQQISLLVSLGLFAHIAALTTLHAIIALSVGFCYEIFVLYDVWAVGANTEHLALYDLFIVLNCHLGIVVCFVWLIFKKNELARNLNKKTMEKEEKEVVIQKMEFIN